MLHLVSEPLDLFLAEAGAEGEAVDLVHRIGVVIGCVQANKLPFRILRLQTEIASLLLSPILLTFLNHHIFPFIFLHELLGYLPHLVRIGHKGEKGQPPGVVVVVAGDGVKQYILLELESGLFA